MGIKQQNALNQSTNSMFAWCPRPRLMVAWKISEDEDILITANHTWWMWRSKLYIYILYLIYVIYILLLCHSLSFYTYHAWSSSVILYNHHCESYILGSWLKPMRMTRTHGIFWAMGHQNFEVCIYLWELVEWNSARTAVCWVWRLANTWFHACNIVIIALKTC
jgi:hypothetical protein